MTLRVTNASSVAVMFVLLPSPLPRVTTGKRVLFLGRVTLWVCQSVRPFLKIVDLGVLQVKTRMLHSDPFIAILHF